MNKTTRREFMHGGLALSAVSLAATGSALARADETMGASAGASATPVLTGSSLPLSELIYERDSAAARAFAAREAGGITALHPIAGDVTSLWYDDLYHRWRQGATLIGGLTGVSALFCLEQLARGQDQRVLLRIEHHAGDDGQLEHRFKGPERLRPVAASMLAASDWASRMPALVRSVSFPVDAAVARQESVYRGPAGPLGRWIEPLATWVIGPRLLSQPGHAGELTRGA